MFLGSKVIFPSLTLNYSNMHSGETVQSLKGLFRDNYELENHNQVPHSSQKPVITKKSNHMNNMKKKNFTSLASFCILSCHRPEMDTEWTYIREPIETNSMVLKGLLPETEYQFIVRAVNVHGASPPSPINNPVRTLGKSDVVT